jgi:hypothetical protein
LTTSEPDEQAHTAPIELPSPASPPPPAPSAESPESRKAEESAAAQRQHRSIDPESEEAHSPYRPIGSEAPAVDSGAEAEAQPRYRPIEASAVALRPATPGEQETLFVPLAVTVGDGFKFGCGFFLALVLAMLVGFVLLAVLFVLTSLFGLNLPISR